MKFRIYPKSLLLSNSQNQMIVLLQDKKRKLQWNNSCKAIGFTLNTTDTDSDNIQENVRVVQCSEPQIVLM